MTTEYRDGNSNKRNDAAMRLLALLMMLKFKAVGMICINDIGLLNAVLFYALLFLFLFLLVFKTISVRVIDINVYLKSLK